MQKNKESGFFKILFVVLIGMSATLYFTKDEQGVSYLEKFIKTGMGAKQHVEEQVKGAEDMLKKRDAEIMLQLDDTRE